MLHIERIRARRLVNGDAGGLLAVEREILAVGLRAELDPADIAQTGDFAVIAGLDDHIGKLVGVGEPALKIDRVLEVDAGRRRRNADLAGGDLLTLLLQ